MIDEGGDQDSPTGGSGPDRQDAEGFPIDRRTLLAGGAVGGIGVVGGAYLLARGDESATFEVVDLTPAEVAVARGESVTIDATVENTGREDGTTTVELSLDDEQVDTVERSIDGGGADTTTFELETDHLEPGDYPIEVTTSDESASGVLTIQGVPEDHVPFSIWAEMQAGLRESPDHLPARAERLVDDGDLEALYEFVRDEVVTVPPKLHSFTDTELVGRWGPRGTLRSGTGTPRDKAELLAELYDRAGYDSEVKVASDFDVEDLGLSATAFRERTLGDVDRTFDPDIDEETVEDWFDRVDVDVDEASNVDALDLDGSEAAALADSLHEYLPEGGRERAVGRKLDSFDWEWHDGIGNRAPVVEVTDGDETIYANLFADVPFGEAGSGEPPSEAPEPEYDTVSVTLSAATARQADQDERFELVSGEWPVPELIGRQIRVRTPSLVSPLDYPNAKLNDLEPFVPTLSLQGQDLTGTETADRSIIGDMFTLGGDRLSMDYEIDGEDVLVDEDSLERNGESLGRTDGDPAAVESVEVAASVADPPRVDLEATVLDGNGDHVGGLPPAAFGALDEGENVYPALVSQSQSATVLVVRDISGSMNRGVDAATDDDRYDELVEHIEDANHGVTVEQRDVDSDIWTHLANAVLEEPDCIVYAHDGRPEDSYREWMEPVFEDAPPTVLLSAQDGGSEVADDTVLDQAARVDGEVAPFGDWDLLKSTVEDVVSALDLPTYRFEYGIPDDATGERTVEFHVGEDPVDAPEATATATYDASDGSRTHGLVGLYLELEMGDRVVDRTIAGYDPAVDDWARYEDAEAEDGTVAPEVAAMAEEVRLAMHGGVDISFEGDGVPYTVALDDMLAGKRSAEHIAVANVEGDWEDKRAAWDQGSSQVQAPLMAVQAPLRDAVTEDGLTFFDGPRVAMYRMRPFVEDDVDEDEVEVGTEEVVDVVPISRATTAAADPVEGFFLTLERTAQIAIIERELFDTTAASVLADLELATYGDLDDDDWEFDREIYREIREGSAGLAGNDILIAPADGSEFVFWNVDRDTGAMYGILRDGSGGGVRRRTVQASDPDKTGAAIGVYMDIIGLLGVTSPMAGPALGAIAAYYAQLAVVYAEAAMMVATMDADAYDDVRGELGNLFDAAAQGSVIGAAGSIPGPTGTVVTVASLANNLAVLLGLRGG